MMIAITSNT